MKSHETATIAGLARPDGWSRIRNDLGIQAFGVNAWTADEAGATVIQEHDEDSGHEELYVVVAGHATFTVNGEEIDAPAGTLVFVRDPKAKRGAVSAEAATTVLAVGAPPVRSSTRARGRRTPTFCRCSPRGDSKRRSRC